MSKKLFITVIGGGNSTLIFACLSKLSGHKVAVLTRQPHKWSKNISFDNEDVDYYGGQHTLSAEIDIVTSDPAECIPQSDMILIAGIPVHHNPKVLHMIAPYMMKNKRVMVGSICAFGGFNWVAAELLGHGDYVIFGTQLIPWFCGTKRYGNKGVVYGAKRMLRIATEDGKDLYAIKSILAEILKISDLRDTDFITSTLWPNNPSLHPPILYGIFKNWDGKSGYQKKDVPVLLYKDLTPDSADALVKMDNELTAIVEALKPHYPTNSHLHLNFHLRDCIIENYQNQVKDQSTIASTVKTNIAFGSHTIPYKELQDGLVVPNLEHKFFVTDLPFGLCLFKDIAIMADVKTPMIDTLIEWNQKLIKKEYIRNGTISGKNSGECILPSKLGLNIKTLDKGRRIQCSL